MAESAAVGCAFEPVAIMVADASNWPCAVDGAGWFVFYVCVEPDGGGEYDEKKYDCHL